MADARAAQEREVSQYWFTSLDRTIQQQARPGSGKPERLYLNLSSRPPSKAADQFWTDILIKRLQALKQMGLAEDVSPVEWHVKGDFAKVLRSMQKTADRQKTLATRGIILSDEKSPFISFAIRRTPFLEGRVLLHGEEEESGRRYLMVEGTDANVYHIYSTSQIDELRSGGQLRPNSFVRIEAPAINEGQEFSIIDMGNCESILHNPAYLDGALRRLEEKRGSLQRSARGGWLGRYQEAVEAAVDRNSHRSRGNEQANKIKAGKRRIER